jgi:hypothetical protein
MASVCTYICVYGVRFIGQPLQAVEPRRRPDQVREGLADLFVGSSRLLGADLMNQFRPAMFRLNTQII